MQYLGPREEALPHWHSQNAFKFVLGSEGLWTVVDGDLVAMRRGDLLLTPGWCLHGHHNAADTPMLVAGRPRHPTVRRTDSQFFEFGPSAVTDRSTSALSQGERLWSYPSLRPASLEQMHAGAPLAAYRWERTDRAVDEQLRLVAEGHPAGLEPGHAAVVFTDPRTLTDALRTEMHRLTAGTVTQVRRPAGSSVWQVFDGEGVVEDNGRTRRPLRGDMVAVSSGTTLDWQAVSTLDLFAFSHALAFEALGMADAVCQAPRGPGRYQRSHRAAARSRGDALGSGAGDRGRPHRASRRYGRSLHRPLPRAQRRHRTGLTVLSTSVATRQGVRVDRPGRSASGDRQRPRSGQKLEGDL